MLTKTGSALNTAAQYTNPLGLAATGVGKLAGLGGKIAGEALGVSTGAGYGAIKGAFNAAQDSASQAAFRAGINGGEEAGNNLIDAAQQAFQDIKAQRSADYQAELASIKAGTHTLGENTIKPILDKFDNLLNQFGVKQTKDGLDFSNSLLRNERVSVGDIEDIYNEIQKYTSGKKQINPVNIDDLKQFIDARYSHGTRGSSFTSQLNGTIRNVLREHVPGYEKMTANYQRVTNDLKEFRQSLSVGGKAARETILQKLTATLRVNNEYRQALLKEFSMGANKDIFSQAAGVSMQSLIPLGLSKYAEGLAAFINPHYLLALPFTSPRIVGEFVNALGKGNSILERIGNAFIKYKGPLVTKAAVISNRQTEDKSKGKTKQ